MSSTKTMTVSLAMAIAMTAWATHAAAADMSCPAAGSIRQNGETKDGDIAYEAVSGAHTWKGEVSQYDDAKLHLEGLSFVGASLINSKDKHWASCDYKATDGNSLRMSLDMEGNAVSPANAKAWKSVAAGKETCTQSTSEACTFK